MMRDRKLNILPCTIKPRLTANDIFYFEKDQNGQFIAPQAHRKHAMLMIANHDVAPFYAWWQQRDIETRKSFSLYSNPEQFGYDITQREQDKLALREWLKAANTLPNSDDASAIYAAVVATLSASNSQFLCLQLDDLSGETFAVNIPGTDQEYPNWRRRLSRNLLTIFGPMSHEEQHTSVQQQRFWPL